MKKYFLAGAFAASLAMGTAYAETKVAIPDQTLNQELHDRLPEEFRKAGVVTAVNSGSFPPYDIIVSAKDMSGAVADMSKALGQVLGIRVEHATVAGLPAVLSGIKAGRFQFGLGPIGDFKSRQEANDFVDWVKEYVVFAVQKGNPSNINGLEDTCGFKIAVMSGGSAEKVIKAQAEKCTAEGKKELIVQSFTDQPTSILAVRSKRADAFFSSQAPLTYFVEQANGDLELTAVGKKNGFSDLYQGAVVPKGSEFGPVLRDAFKILIENGTYQIIMKKWGLENNMLLEPGINIAKD